MVNCGGMKSIGLILLSFLASALPSSAAIFGNDTRISITENSAYFPQARATAIAVISTSEAAPGKLKLPVDSPSSLCRDERFSQDPTLAYSCTGFLVASDLIVTAGHCMVNVGESRNETETYCKAYSWLFDYNGSSDPEAIPAENLYHCKQVVYAVREEHAPFRDFALVQLDRPVTGRAPYALARNSITGREALSMIGHPFGTPAKLSRDAQVLLNNPERQSFITNLNAFEGNSGSPVFNHAHEVVGILIGGTPSESLLKDKARSCNRYNRCSEDGANCTVPDTGTSQFPGFQRTGSEVQRIIPVRELIEAFKRN